MSIYKNYLKRILDILFSIIGLILLFPVFLIVAVSIRIKLGTPVIFKQKRPGKEEKIFELYKFRTMSDEKDENGNLLPDSERLPRFGQFLRSTSLDELPELWNILKGDMSIVGPRPLLIRYLPYYTNEERKRHSVRPGLTGLAQIKGRNNLAWDDRLGYDKKYVHNISFVLDFKVLLKTVMKVLKKEDVTIVDLGTLESLDIERGKHIGVKKNRYQ